MAGGGNTNVRDKGLLSSRLTPTTEEIQQVGCIYLTITILLLYFFIFSGISHTGMTPTDNLYQLIKSLTANEKRYFKVFAGRHVVGKQNKYELLFDIYDSLPDDQYDEADLKLKLKKKRLGKNLSDDKKNLQDIIMRAMRNYHSGTSVDTQLNDLMADEDFYRQKRLNDLRRKTITKAKEIAEKYEKYNILLTLIDREISMRIELNQHELADIADSLDTEKKVVLEKINTIAALRDINQWFFIHFRLNPNNKSEIFWAKAEEILKKPIITGYKDSLCFNADYNYLKIFLLYYQIKGDYINQNIFSKRLYELYQDNYALQKKYNPLQYKVDLYNYLTSLHQINDYLTMGKLLEYAEMIPSQTEDEAGEDFQNLVFYKQIYYMNTGRFDQAVKLVPYIQAGLWQYRNKVNKARELAIYNNIATVFLILENWDEVHTYTEKILSDKTNVRMDIKYNCMLLQLLVLYESGNYDVLSYQLRNVERTLKKRAITESESIVIKILQNLLKKGSDYFKADKSEVLSRLPQLKSKPDFQIWLHSRLTKTPIHVLASP